MTEADIQSFAGLSGDFNPLHTDQEWVSANTPYRGRIAHGLLVLSMSSGMTTAGLDQLEVLAYMEVQRRMVAPTYPGDTLRVLQTIESMRPSSKQSTAGIVTVNVSVTNQDSAPVQTGYDVLLVRRDAQ
ncbi:MaoC family dehydratase [Rhodococcus fascians]|nr:MaoC family dehydratase [Rhodococcus fascians]MBY4254261.1 MaoC family dehydratase [Rhodococcus fascians]MBY4269642.1 MaoC family dehydratase [Rhodococcus fascians]